MEASPNGVLLLDARRPDRVVQHARRRPLRARPAARPAPAHHEPGPLAGVRRLPAGGRLRRAADTASAARAGLAAGADPPLRRRPEAGAVAGPHRARARRRDAARLRRQRLARDPHAAHGAGGLPRDAAQPAAERGRAQARARADVAAGGAHGAPGRGPAHARAPRRQPEAGRRPLGRASTGCCCTPRPRRARSRRAGTRSSSRPAPAPRSQATKASCAARSATCVSNAIRYTPDGGRIEVGWRIAGDGRGQIAVSDTGPGIARVHLPRLTERFYRVDSSRSRESGGTGLGLAIVKHVMQRHGGELDIESEPGKGSTFRLVFPAVRVRLAAPAAWIGCDAAATRRWRRRASVRAEPRDQPGARRKMSVASSRLRLRASRATNCQGAAGAFWPCVRSRKSQAESAPLPVASTR